MESEFPWRTLGEVTDNYDRLRVPVRKSDRIAGPFPYYGASGIADYVNEFIFDGDYLLIAEDGENLRTQNTPIAFMARGKFWVNNHAHIVRGNGSADTEFLCQALQVIDVKPYLSGTTRPKLTQRDLNHIEVPIPPLSDQRRIAAVLGALDDKIELNRQMNRTLEEMAQAIFKSWFIDFDGRDDLVDSDQGPMPRGWNRIPFAEAGTWVSGGTPSKKEPSYWGGELPWFSAKSLGPLWLHDSEAHVTESGAAFGTRRVPRRSVLFIVRGMSLATEWRIGITSREATLNQDLKAIVDDDTVLPELLLLWLLVNRESIRAKADEAGHGTKRLPTDVLHSHSIVMPLRAEQDRMARPLISLLERIEVNQFESRVLADLRDTLLPKLVSGELRVPDGEAAIGGVAS